MTTLLLLRHSIPEHGGSSPDPGLSAEGLQRPPQSFKMTLSARSRSSGRPLRCVRSRPHSCWGFPSGRIPALPSAAPATRPGRALRSGNANTKTRTSKSGRRVLREVSARMADCIHELLDSLPEGQNALVVSHAAAICSYLQRFCTVEVTDAAQKLRRITFQGEVLLDGHFWEADGFVLHIENRRPVLIRTYAQECHEGAMTITY